MKTVCLLILNVRMRDLSCISFYEEFGRRYREVGAAATVPFA